MANNPGAKKRIRQNAVRRLRNRYKLSTTRTAIKKLRDTSDKEAATKLLAPTISKIDRCVKANLWHKNKAARLKSGLTKYVQGLS
ncbi:MAG: 30S ribosomal protein S20 [Bacteroidota bacterium]